MKLGGLDFGGFLKGDFAKGLGKDGTPGAAGGTSVLAGASADSVLAGGKQDQLHGNGRAGAGTGNHHHHRNDYYI